MPVSSLSETATSADQITRVNALIGLTNSVTSILGELSVQIRSLSARVDTISFEQPTENAAADLAVIRDQIASLKTRIDLLDSIAIFPNTDSGTIRADLEALRDRLVAAYEVKNRGGIVVWER